MNKRIEDFTLVGAHAQGVTYLAAVTGRGGRGSDTLNGVMEGGTISRVEETRNRDFAGIPTAWAAWHWALSVR